MAAFLATQRDWLVVERLPGCAPDLNPSSSSGPTSRATSWPTSRPKGRGEVIAAARQGIERIRAAWHLPYSFLRHCGLSVS
jgi:hypothetical protein